MVKSFIKSKINKLILIPFGLIIELWRVLLDRVHLQLFYNRSETIKLFAGRERDLSSMKQPRVLAVITHVCASWRTGRRLLSNNNEERDREEVAERTARLRRTIDSLVCSFAHCDLVVLINTIKDMHITDYLPKYQRDFVRVIEQQNCKPMFVMFKAQDEFIKQINDFDWFLFLEDDVLINDSCFLDKLDSFNKFCGIKNAILLPHRYEMLEKTKAYIDRDFSKKNTYMWNKLTVIEIGNLKFAEFQNPHAAMYCLSKEQLEMWVKSGRKWYNKVTFMDPLASAGTGCLFECFRIYKPNIDNMHYLEVQHWDTYYSKSILKRRKI